MAYTLLNPAPGHSPDVGRIYLGKTFGGGRSYGTTLRCGCGWKPEVERTFRWVDGKQVVTEHRKTKVSNESPSKGGRTVAQHRYRQHLIEEGLVHA